MRGFRQGEAEINSQKYSVIAYIGLPNYRGWGMTMILQPKPGKRYKIECCTWGRGLRMQTTETFSIEQREEAITAGKKLIDDELDFHLFNQAK